MFDRILLVFSLLTIVICCPATDGSVENHTVNDNQYSWQLLNDEPGFLPNDGAGLLSLNGTLYLLGGWQGSPPYGPGTSSEVWLSEDDGVTWDQLPDAPWGARHCAGWVVFKDRLFVVSGDGNNDVWSSADGINWYRVLQNAPWSARTHFSVVNTPRYIYITDGSVGTQANLSNEVWRSKDGCTWEEVKFTPWSERHASSLVYHNGKLIISSGFFVADVWELETE